jgi:hypothetical protein
MAAGSIDLKYEYVGGAHLLWSEAPLAKGLCVANKDLKKAFASAAHQLKVLAKVNHGLDLEFTPAISAEAFGEWLKETYSKVLQNKPDYVTPHLSSVLMWQQAQAKAA